MIGSHRLAEMQDVPGEAASHWIRGEVVISLLWHFEPDVIKLFEPPGLLLCWRHLVVSWRVANFRMLYHVFLEFFHQLVLGVAQDAASQIFLIEIAVGALLQDLCGSDFVFPAALLSLA